VGLETPWFVKKFDGATEVVVGLTVCPVVVAGSAVRDAAGVTTEAGVWAVVFMAAGFAATGAGAGFAAFAGTGDGFTGFVVVGVDCAAAMEKATSAIVPVAKAYRTTRSARFNRFIHFSLSKISTVFTGGPQPDSVG
jgi:hypothetical protein